MRAQDDSRLAPESLMISWSFLPPMPPLAFSSSVSISRVLASGAPRNDAGPVTARMAPTLIVSAARTGALRTAMLRMARAKKRMIIMIVWSP